MADNSTTPEAPPTTADHLAAAAQNLHDAGDAHYTAGDHHHAAAIHLGTAAGMLSENPHPDAEDNAPGDVADVADVASQQGSRAMPPVSAQARAMTAVKGNATTNRVYRSATGRRG